MGWRVVLTSDRATMTDYNDTPSLGFGHCVPYRLVPRPVYTKLLAPPMKVDGKGRAVYAPYPLRKLEAALLNSGFSEDDVIITTPEALESVVSEDTEVLGVSVLDPMGLAPVSYTLRVLFGGGDTCTKVEFLRLMSLVRRLKARYGFTVVAGGEGVWQIDGLEERFGIDTLFYGEGEKTFPELVRDILSGSKPPRKVYGESPDVDEIPPIVAPARGRIVQVTRGCPRKCRFCSPTTWRFRSMPLDLIRREVEVNLRYGGRSVDFVSDDILLYGARGIHVNREAVLSLFRMAREYGVCGTFPHVGPATVLQDRELVREITELSGFSERRPVFLDVGLESGSPRIIGKYMRGKPAPWKPEDWPRIVVEATEVMNDNYWYPCYTMIVGFPDETPDDIVKTIELVDELRSMDAKAWTFPLLMIPMGGTGMESEAFPSVADLEEEVWELYRVCWLHSLRFSEYIADRLFSTLRNPFLRGLSLRLVNSVLDFLREFFDKLARDPEAIMVSMSDVNVNSVRWVANAMFNMSKGVLLRLVENVIHHA